ncbi:ABC transporter ATP-binding protein [Desulfitibacter alkalitolerans]|uniref:ABC transporter ATP-binding protein n=1 Tax=Desulfitibacter alkalitolerans TaxID=264641 RepID=UPI000483AF4E|nr:ABC transporter ATP-binding protein [Desulfitibacter alkalitolerans]
MRKNTFAEETISGKIYDWQLIKRLLKYVRPYWGYVIFSLILIMVVSGVVVARPYIVKIAIDNHILGDGNFNNIIQLVIIYFTIITMGFAANYLQNYLLNYASQRILYDIREAVFTHLQGLSLSFFDKNPVGRLVTRVANDTANLNEMFTEVLIGFIRDFILIAAIIIVMLQLDLRLAAISLISIPLILFATNVYKKVAQRAFQQARVKLAALNSSIQENITGMKIVQIFNQQESRFKEYETINKEHYEAELKAIKAHALFRPSIDIIFFFILVLLIWYGGAGVIQDTMQLGVLYAFINYTERLFQPINDMTQKYTQLQSAVVSSERIFMLLDEKETVKDPITPIPLKEVQGKIEFKNVWFAYNDQDWVLKDVSFEIRPGETVALVGPTGSGKTTVINLINRLYDVQKGDIFIDNMPIKELSQASLRRSIAAVMQDVFLFSDSIMANIHLDSSRIHEEIAKKATGHVGADDFISKLPGGYDYQVKERGITLSTGQRQLIAFARALAFDPKILILDEATANIDSQSEAIIQNAMEKLSKNRTTIIVAHRLSTVQNADKILVFHKGRIIESGSHQELLKRRGMYYKLYQLQ